MAMSSYNRQNPFMYLLEVKQDKLQEKSENALKRVLIMSGLSFFELVSNSIGVVFLDMSYIPVLCISAFLLWFAWRGVRDCIGTVKNDEMEEMIFGKEFQYINVNNEKLLVKINEYNYAIGKVDMLTEMVYIFDVFYIITFVYFIIQIIAHFI